MGRGSDEDASGGEPGEHAVSSGEAAEDDASDGEPGEAVVGGPDEDASDDVVPDDRLAIPDAFTRDDLEGRDSREDRAESATEEGGHGRSPEASAGSDLRHVGTRPAIPEPDASLTSVDASGGRSGGLLARWRRPSSSRSTALERWGRAPGPSPDVEYEKTRRARRERRFDRARRGDSADDPYAWTVDPWTSRTVRWLLLVQAALVDAGVLLAGLGVLVAFAFAIEYGSLAVLAVLVLLVAARALAIVPLERWRWHGPIEALATEELLLAIAAGWALYLALFWATGAGAFVVLAIAFVGLGLATSFVGDGRASGRVDGVAGGGDVVDDRDDAAGGQVGVDGQVTFDGRSRSLASVTGLSSYRVGDLVLVRLHGPIDLDECRWLVVPVASADRICTPIWRAAWANTRSRSSVDPRSEHGTAGPDWRRLVAPRFVLYAIGVGLVVVGVVALVAPAGPTSTVVRLGPFALGVAAVVCARVL